MTESRSLALDAVAAALDKKAFEPVLLDVRKLASYTDHIVIVSARSDRQVHAVAQHVEETLRQGGRRLLGSEGGGTGHWVLLDYGDLVVHVFYHPLREFYDLEGLWIDAPRVALEVPPELRAAIAWYYG